MRWREYQDALAAFGHHWSANRYRSLALNVARRLPVVQGKCVDVGCGEGLVTYALKKRHPDLKVCGTDISHVRLSRAAQRISETTFITGDVTALPWVDESFEAVVCCEVLEHLSDHVSAVKELFRILKKEGVLLITVPDREKLSWVICAECGARIYKDGHLRCFCPNDVRDLLAPWGDVLSVKPIGKKWRMLKRWVAAAVIPGKEYKGRYLLAVARKR